MEITLGNEREVVLVLAKNLILLYSVAFCLDLVG